MQPFLRYVLRGALRVLFKGVIGRPIPERVQRAWMVMVASSTLRAGDTRTERGTWGVPGEWTQHRHFVDGRVLLYLHGGGYTIGSPRTHRALTSHLAAAARCQVLVPDYRLAPEHPYPAALQDTLAAYRCLLERFAPEQIAIGGDSAGGGLTLCTALAIRDAGLPMPRALVLLSPWTDLGLSGETIDGLDAIDPMLGRAWLQRAVDAYRGDLPASDPRVSPLHASLHGLPPMLVQVGSDEILLSDSRRLVEKARAGGLDVRLEIEPGYWHDFQIHAGVLDAADAAIGRIADFLRDRWAPA
jgi:acetyl esterase/lipase